MGYPFDIGFCWGLIVPEMRILTTILLFTLSQANQWGAPIERIAFGSCAKQNRPQPIWNTVQAFQPELWIWTGDCYYGDSVDSEVLAAKASKQKLVPGYVGLRDSCAVIGVWDDHDYGINNGGVEYPAKEISQRAFLDFIDEPVSSDRRSQQGIYWDYEYGEDDQEIQVILLDVRYFRDSPKASDPDVLGEAQWTWLEKCLDRSEASVHFIVSGIQVLHEDHKYEKWANFPASRNRLLNLATEKAKGRVVFLSGDRHIGEFARMEYGPSRKELVEVTSSSLTHSWNTFPGEPNRHRIGKVYSENNFGSIELDWEKRELFLGLRGLRGKMDRSMRLPFD